METLGKRIRHARRAKKLTQKAVAKHFGISRVSVTQWESDDTHPASDKLSALAGLFGVSEEWLISNKGPAPEVPKNRYQSKKEEADNLWPDLDDGDQAHVLDLMRRLSGRAFHE